MKTPISARRLAANRANAGRSTGPRTPEGKARSSQNARKYVFDPGKFAVIRVEDVEKVAALRADAVDFYQPVNSQEMFAVERIAMAQHDMLRVAQLGTGLFTRGLEDATTVGGHPWILRSDEITRDIEITRGQNHAYWLACGFRISAHQSETFKIFLRMQAQSERLYRRAVEEFERLKDLRTEFDTEPMPDPGVDESKGPGPRKTNPPEEPEMNPETVPAVSPEPAIPPETAPDPRKAA